MSTLAVSVSSARNPYSDPTLCVVEQGLNEAWTRTFGNHVYQSRVESSGATPGQVEERLPSWKRFLHLHVDVESPDPHTVLLKMNKMSVGFIPIPSFLCPSGLVVSRVDPESGAFSFRLDASLPFFGPLLTYTFTLPSVQEQ